jgi:Tfp pilus assembly protein PilX
MRRTAGYALPLALVLLGIVTLLLAQALGGAAGEAALAANQQFRQAAFEAAEGGLLGARGVLQAAPGLPTTPILRQQPGAERTRSTTQLQLLDEAPPPAGYSLDRFTLQHLELRSRGEAPRGANITLVEGLDRLVTRP